MAVLRHIIHPYCTDLHLNMVALAVLHSGMQRLVAVWFGIGNPVPQTFCIRLVLLGYAGVHLPAVVVLLLKWHIQDKPHCKNIIHLLKRDILLLHLFPD